MAFLTTSGKNKDGVEMGKGPADSTLMYTCILFYYRSGFGIHLGKFTISSQLLRIGQYYLDSYRKEVNNIFQIYILNIHVFERQNDRGKEGERERQ